MDKSEFLTALAAGPVRFRLAGAFKQATTNVEYVCGDEDAQGFLNMGKKMSVITKDDFIGVWDFGSNSVVAIDFSDVAQIATTQSMQGGIPSE